MMTIACENSQDPNLERPGTVSWVEKSTEMAALERGVLEIHGDGSQSRSFLHVRDAVRAILALSACTGAEGQVFNVGGTEPVTILELANRVLRTVRETTGTTGAILARVPYEEVYGPGFEDLQRRLPSIEKIRRLTGWEPAASCRETAHLTHNLTQADGKSMTKHPKIGIEYCVQ